MVVRAAGLVVDIMLSAVAMQWWSCIVLKGCTMMVLAVLVGNHHVLITSLCSDGEPASAICASHMTSSGVGVARSSLGADGCSMCGCTE